MVKRLFFEFRYRRDLAIGRFHYDEHEYYGFGLRLGLANLKRNGFRLGLGKTVSLISQPINSPWRFPEYYFVDHAVRDAFLHCDRATKPKVLDVGSPKCFGLYLAYNAHIEMHLTDIDETTVRESCCLWEAICTKASGTVSFSINDVRSLPFPDNSFDVVYSMSVVEHIEGDDGDSRAIAEMVRVLRPGGTLAVTVPLGDRYVEQDILGFRRAAQRTSDRAQYFFQRVYSAATVEQRLFRAAPQLILKSGVSVERTGVFNWQFHGRLGRWSGLFGFFFPLLSTLGNANKTGLTAPRGRYGQLNTARDIYGDAILVWRKLDLIGHEHCLSTDRTS